MVNISSILILIGILVVIISTIVIFKNNKEYQNIYDEVNIMYKKIKDYSNNIEIIVNDMEDIVDKFLLMTEANNVGVKGRNKSKDIIKQKSTIDIKDTSNIVQEKELDVETSYENEIVRLHEIGLTNEEIAKTLNKGIREINIILKMHTMKNNVN
ncbi:DUF6115 domain-containing protein [Dethiothermospora halolimnae]|uniref:DUF6115 domain-containing protein n=1 Tax=Dethiothermospora halolimnae TaxID=3114390 RepID=UPI003CCC0CCD